MMIVKNDPKVFIAGSRSLSRLSAAVRQRLDNVVRKGLAVIVGDANGIDKAVQRYLHSRHYTKVTVFCMQGRCRNNVGGWLRREIAAGDALRHDFAYYSTKDRAMVEEADYGLMLWDGHSRGTLRSIVDLVKHGKLVIAFVSSAESFYTLRQPEDIADLLARVAPDTLQGLDPDLRSFAMSARSNHKPESAPLF